MSKYHKIKWTKSDNKELARVARNYNAKIDRLMKKDPSKILNDLPEGMKVNKNALPEKVSVRQLKKLIKTRRDLNREINSLKRFTQKGAEKIVVVPDTDYNLQVTSWQMKEMNRRVGIINPRRKNRLDMIREMGVAGHDFTLGELGMGKQAENELAPTTSFYRSMTQTDLKWKYKSLLAETQSSFFTERDYQVRENYIKGIKENYPTNLGLDEVIEAIEKMDIKDFLDKFLSVDLNTFEWASGPPNDEGYEAYAKKLKAEWLGLADDELGFSTKSRARYGVIANDNVTRSSNNVGNLEDYIKKHKLSEVYIMDFENNMIIKSFK